MAEIIYHGMVAAHTDEKQIEGYATYCSICRDWFKPVLAGPAPAYAKAAQTALDCQDACNLSGVAKDFAGPVLDALWAEARRTNQGTDWINQHPIVTLFLDKLASLNRSQCLCSTTMSKYAIANAAVEQIARGEAVTPTPYHTPTH